MKIYSRLSLGALESYGAPISSLIKDGTFALEQGSLPYEYIVPDNSYTCGTSLKTLIANKLVVEPIAPVACLKFSGPTEHHTTSITVGMSAELSSEYYRNPAWDDVKGSDHMFCWALPKGSVYTDTLTPVVEETHPWAKVNGEWIDLTTLEEPLSIYNVGNYAFDTLALRSGANVEVSDNGTTWSAWNPDGVYLEAEITVEGKEVVTYCDRYPDGDKTISGVDYKCWLSKPEDLYTTAETPVVGATVYTITEGVVASAGTVEAVRTTGYSYNVKNGTVYVRAKSGTTPIFGFSGLFAKVSGPVMSLVDYEDSANAVLSSCQFSRVIYYGSYDEAGLFYDINSTFLESSSAPFLSDASGLVMPTSSQVTADSSYALSMMFNNCITLGGDKLPVLTTPAIAQGLYDCFCYGCISIKHLPEGYLDDTFTSTPGKANYSFMFSRCMSLEDIPDGFLDTNYLGDVFWSDNYWGYQSAYTEMFSECYSLKSVPTDLLPATTLTPCCYGHMFMNCMSLENAPDLDAQNIQPGCYKGMFEGCSSITECPELPATILPSSVVIANNDSHRGCYQRMFMGCSSIVDAPALTAINLTEMCYSEMFEDCTSLSNVTCLALDITAYDSLASWLSGVAESGSFHRNSTQWAYYPIDSPSGIPEGWTIDPEVGDINLKVYYPYQGTGTHLSFVRYPYGDETVDSTHYYAWTIGTSNFDTLYTTSLQSLTTSSQLYIKSGEVFVNSSATIESGIFTGKKSIVVENLASGVASNGITYTVSEGSYTNTVQSFTGAITSDSSVTISVSGSGWVWGDDSSTTSPRTFEMPEEGLYVLVSNAVVPESPAVITAEYGGEFMAYGVRGTSSDDDPHVEGGTL